MKRLALLLLLLLSASLLGCADSRPRLLIVSIDSLRADRLRYGDDGESLAPHLEALASESLVYRHAWSSAPWTTPSMMSVMTGLPAAAHRVDDHDRALSREIPTLAESFRRAGYRTAAYVPAVTLRPEFGFGRGFEEYDYEEYGHRRVSTPSLLGKVLHRIDAWNDDGPWLIWVHLWDPHYNYLPPAPYDLRYLRGDAPASAEVQCLKWYKNPVTTGEGEYLAGQYDGEIAFTDHQLGELLGELEERGLAEDTIVALFADHGEAFLEHGWLGHTNRVDETLLHVPLMIRYPGKLEPGTQESPQSLASLANTLLRLAGLPEESAFAPALPLAEPSDVSRSKVPMAEPSELGRPAPPLAETRRRGCFTALIDSRFKYVLDQNSCDEELFELSSDPLERKNLAGLQPQELLRLRQELLRQLREIETRRYPRAMLPPEIREEAQKRLRSVGYIGGGETSSEEMGEDPCAGALAGGLDTFGDRNSAIRCPERGALDCLDRLLPSR